MVAARLGNLANRAALVQDFWWNSDSGMKNVLRQAAALHPDWPWGGQRALAREFGVGEQWATSPCGSARRCEGTGDVTGPVRHQQPDRP
jgi:hypothetical protein